MVAVTVEHSRSQSSKYLGDKQEAVEMEVEFQDRVDSADKLVLTSDPSEKCVQAFSSLLALVRSYASLSSGLVSAMPAILSAPYIVVTVYFQSFHCNCCVLQLLDIPDAASATASNFKS